uniref:Conserved hypothetical plastid protein n=1 Tax=Mastocarpus papillatus TaxID=31436 RepID=A0A342RZ85_9FLOR|nr:conserved hypothetical plastid protein [Mastocarpus papillatus]AOL58031.1 conserved hypothetical plastid protein [Mastocarpus papillatus]
MPTIYLISLVTFLFPICLLITIELYKLCRQFFIINNILKRQDKENINSYESLQLAQIYLKQKKWISSIIILESNINQENKIIEQFYNCIGFCYCQIKHYNLSQYYYLQAIKKQPIYLSALHNLAKLYEILNDYKNTTDIYIKILKIDNKNKKAKQKLIMLNTKKYNRDSRI